MNIRAGPCTHRGCINSLEVRNARNCACVERRTVRSGDGARVACELEEPNGTRACLPLEAPSGLTALEFHGPKQIPANSPALGLKQHLTFGHPFFGLKIPCPRGASAAGASAAHVGARRVCRACHRLARHCPTKDFGSEGRPNCGNFSSKH